MKRRYDWITQQTQKTGAPNGKFWEKGLKPTTTSVKLSEAILSIFGDCWEKMYPFLTPRKTDGRVPNQQGTTYNLQPDLLGSFAEDVYVQTLNYGPLWVLPKGKIQTFSWGVGGGGWSFWHITHSSYSRHQILFLPHLPPSKNLPQEQIFWGTDPLNFPWKEGTDGQAWRRLKRIAIVLFKVHFYCLWSLI